jgi:hypothetical protein
MIDDAQLITRDDDDISPQPEDQFSSAESFPQRTENAPRPFHEDHRVSMRNAMHGGQHISQFDPRILLSSGQQRRQRRAKVPGVNLRQRQDSPSSAPEKQGIAPAPGADRFKRRHRNAQGPKVMSQKRGQHRLPHAGIRAGDHDDALHPRMKSGAVRCGEPVLLLPCYRRVTTRMNKLLRLLGCLALLSLAGPGCARMTKEKPPIYDERADGERQLATALVEARRTNQRVLLNLGANWCSDSQGMFALFNTNREIARVIEENYVFDMIDVNKRGLSARNSALLERLGEPVNRGIPVILILDAEGKVLNNDPAERLADTAHQHPAMVLAYLRKWSGRTNEPPARKALSLPSPSGIRGARTGSPP